MTQLSRTQIILRNIVCNWLGYVVQAVVVFFLTPYVLRELGEARYGVWALITSVTGTYGLLAFGLQGGVNQYLTRYLASRDYQKMNEVASTATAVLSLVGVVILLASLSIAALFPYIFDVPADLTREVRLCTVIVAASVAVQMSLFVFSSAFMATQRYDLSNLIGVGTRLLSAGSILTALKYDCGLVGISVATAAVNTIDYLLRWKVAYILIPELGIRKRLVTWPIFKEMFSFGAWSFLGTVAQTLRTSSDAVIIGLMLPISMLAPYSLAVGLIRQLDGLLAPVIMVFFPAFTELHSRDDPDGIRRVYLTGSRLFLVVVAVSAVITGVFAEDFYRLWVGSKYVDGIDHPSVAILYQILLAAMVFRLLPGIGSQLLLGTLNVRQLTITYVTESLANLLFAVVLIRYFGLVGVAFAALLSAAFCRSFVVPVLAGRIVSVRISAFARHAWLRPFMVAFALTIFAAWVRSLHSASNFSELILLGSIAALGSLPLIIAIGMTSEDRQQLIYQPVTTIWRRAIVGKRCAKQESDMRRDVESRPLA